MLSVAIAVASPAEPADVPAIVSSCEQAIGQGRCRDAAELATGSVVTWFAVVTVDPQGNPEIKIEFHDRRADGALIEERVLAFSERDGPASRWASVGAVVAAFVAARDTSTQPEPRHEKPAPPPPVLPPPPLREPAPAWNIDVGLLTGPGLDRGAFRLGGFGRGDLELPGTRGVLGLVSVRYAERPGDLKLAFWSASAGLGARLGRRSSTATVELTGELLYERLVATAYDPATFESDSVAQNRFGGRLSVNLALGISSNLAFVAGAEATALRPSVAIAVGDDATGRAPAVGFALSAGLRVAGGD